MRTGGTYNGGGAQFTQGNPWPIVSRTWLAANGTIGGILMNVFSLDANNNVQIDIHKAGAQVGIEGFNDLCSFWDGNIYGVIHNQNPTIPGIVGYWALQMAAPFGQSITLAAMPVKNILNTPFLPGQNGGQRPLDTTFVPSITGSTKGWPFSYCSTTFQFGGVDTMVGWDGSTMNFAPPSSQWRGVVPDTPYWFGADVSPTIYVEGLGAFTKTPFTFDDANLQAAFIANASTTMTTLFGWLTFINATVNVHGVNYTNFLVLTKPDATEYVILVLHPVDAASAAAIGAGASARRGMITPDGVLWFMAPTINNAVVVSAGLTQFSETLPILPPYNLPVPPNNMLPYRGWI